MALKNTIPVTAYVDNKLTDLSNRLSNEISSKYALSNVVDERLDDLSNRLSNEISSKYALNIVDKLNEIKYIENQSNIDTLNDSLSSISLFLNSGLLIKCDIAISNSNNVSDVIDQLSLIIDNIRKNDNDNILSGIPDLVISSLNNYDDLIEYINVINTQIRNKFSDVDLIKYEVMPLINNLSININNSLSAKLDKSMLESYDRDVVSLKANKTDLNSYVLKSGDTITGKITINNNLVNGDNNRLNDPGIIHAHAEGRGTTVYNSWSHTEGYNTKTRANYSHAEGFNTITDGIYSHAEGSNTTAQGSGSHAEGSNTTAQGSGSHAEGSNTTAYGTDSHAEGVNTFAYATGSHAEGRNTSAYGTDSHAEGLGSITDGHASHAEGGGKAHGVNSHAEGRGVTGISAVCAHAESGGQANGDRSYAAANGIANADFSRAIGNNAIVKNNDKYAFSWDGNEEKTSDYESHGPGTFNINPKNGLSGFYIGESNIHQIIDSTLQHEIPNKVRYEISTISNNNNTFIAKDRAINNLGIISTSDDISIAYPSETNGYARDFLIRFTISVPENNTLPPINWTVDKVSFESDDANVFNNFENNKTYIMMFSEMENNRFLVSRKEVDIIQLNQTPAEEQTQPA